MSDNFKLVPVQATEHMLMRVPELSTGFYNRVIESVPLLTFKIFQYRVRGIEHGWTEITESQFQMIEGKDHIETRVLYGLRPHISEMVITA